MSKFKTNHKGYNEHATDPLVVLLMEMYSKDTGDKKIPDIWMEFAKNSTPGTSIDLMLAQFGRWKVKEEDLDITLRGDDLFNALQNLNTVKLFRHADIINAGGVPWPEALERAMTQAGTLPTLDEERTMRLGSAQINVNLNYVEKGTLQYSVQRSIPNVPVLVSAAWITENCGPNFSDEQIQSQWFKGIDTQFQLGGVENRVQGFELRAWLKKILRNCSPDRFSTNALYSDMNPMFPVNLTGVILNGEQQFSIKVLNPKPNSLKLDKDVTEREITFKSPTTYRGPEESMRIHFPLFTQQAETAITTRGLKIPEVKQKFLGRLADVTKDPQGTKALQLVEALRGIYNTINNAAEYAALRKKRTEK